MNPPIYNVKWRYVFKFRGRIKALVVTPNVYTDVYIIRCTYPHTYKSRDTRVPIDIYALIMIKI